MGVRQNRSKLFFLASLGKRRHPISRCEAWTAAISQSGAKEPGEVEHPLKLLALMESTFFLRSTLPFAGGGGGN